MFEPKDKEIFQYQGKTYKTIKAEEDSCKHCSFDKYLTTKACDKFSCESCFRKDGHDVIFLEI